jgi:hypothetical protein
MFNYDDWPAYFPTNTHRWFAVRFAGLPVYGNDIEVRGFPSEEAAWAWVRMISYED